MTIENSAIAAQTRPAVETLVNNVQRVVDGKAYGIDEQGELIGDALRSSFKGKVADLLVRTGIAKPGNLAGRLAAGLVGREEFNLIAAHRANPDQFAKSSVANAIAVMSDIKRAAVHDDSDLLRVVGTELSKLTARVALRELVPDGASRAGRLMDMHQALHEVVIPQRIHNRQMVLEDVREGRPTAAMRGELAPPTGMRGEQAPDGRPVVEQSKIYPDELRAAARAISDPGLATGTDELGREGQQAVLLRQVSGAGRRASGAATARAESILTEFNRACQLIRSEFAEGGEEAQGRVEQFRKQYLEVLEQEFNRMDAEDGARTRRDGAVSRPVHDAGVLQSELDEEAKTPFVRERAIVNVGTTAAKAGVEPTGDAFQDALNQLDATFEKADERVARRSGEASKSVAFGGESRQDFAMRRSMAEFPNVDMPKREFPGDAPVETRANVQSPLAQSLNHIEALLDPEGVYAAEMAGKDIEPKQIWQLADPDNSDDLNFHQLAGFAKELNAAFLNKDTEPANRAKAARLAGHPNFAQHLDTIKLVLPILDRLKAAPGGESSENAYQLVAPVMRNVAQAELSRAQDRLDRPDAPENAEWYESFEDAFTMKVADSDSPGETRSTQVPDINNPGKTFDGRTEARAEAMSVVKDAQKVIQLLDAVDAYFADADRIEEGDG